MGVAWNAPGCGFAVRFTPPFQDCKIVKAKLYFHALNNPSDPIKVRILDSNKNDLITPIDYRVTQDQQKTWIEIDVSSYNLVVSNDFYIVEEQVVAGDPDIGSDTSSSHSGRSWQFYGPNWQAADWTNYMLRAVVEPTTPVPTPTENEGEISTEAGGLNIMIKYPKRVIVGETNNIIVELITKDFEDPGYPDLENNIFDGVIKIASDESMNRGDINLFMCPKILWDLGPKPINWPNKPQYYKYEDLIDSQVGEIDMQIFEIAMRLLSVVPIANFPFGMYDVLHWDPSSIAEATKEKYTEGQAPTDICFYDENNYDCWEHSWNFNYYASNVVSENGVKLVFPFYFEEPGTKRVSTYTEVNYELSSCFGIVGCKKLGKTYDFKIEVLSE